MSMVLGLYSLPSCKFIKVFKDENAALSHDRGPVFPTARYGHPVINGPNTENVIYCMNTLTGENEATFYVARGEEWYFEILHQEAKKKRSG